MSDQLTPERVVRLLRVKAAELEAQVKRETDSPYSLTRTGELAAAIALIAGLLADHIEQGWRGE